MAWFQMGLPIQSNSSSRHYAGLKSYLVVLTLTSTTAYFDNNLCNKGEGKCNDLQFGEVLHFSLKGINFADLNSI